MSRGFKRKVDTRDIKKVIRIYAEGGKTEPNYFQSLINELELTQVHVEIVPNNKTAPLSIVDQVIEDKEKDSDDLPVDWWVVFDRDDHPNFQHAIDKARSRKIDVAYSHECFELWLLLHFERMSSALRRGDIIKKLEQKIDGYDKNDPKIYNKVKYNEESALRNAKSLEQEHDSQGNEKVDDRNPSTQVFLLVESLRNLKK